jgi:mannosyltransferase
MTSSRIPWELAAIFLAGLSLRLYGLDAEGFWRDEVSSVNVAVLDLPRIIANRSADVHPPLYYFLLHYWMALWGSSEFAVRSLSAAFGSIAVWPMYRIGSLLFNHYVGVLSALGFAVSEFQIQYSQEAKGYSLMGLLTLLSFVSLVELLRQHGRFAATRYVLSTALLMYTHVYALFVVLSQNIYYFFSARLSRPAAMSSRRWILLQGLLFLAYLPWAGVLLGQVKTVQERFWLKQPTPLSLVDTFASYSGSHFSLALLLLLVLAAGVVKMEEKRDRLGREKLGSFPGNFARDMKPGHGESIALVLIWLLTPVVVPFLISLWATPIYLTRGTISAASAFQIVVAGGIESLGRGRALSVGLVGVVLVVSLVNVTQYYRKVRKEQWREAAAYVDGRAAPQTLLLFTPHFCQQPFDYYSRRKDLIKHPLTDALSRESTGGEITIPPAFAGHERAWIIACDERRAGVEGKQTLPSGHLLIVEQHYKGVTLLGFRRKEQ